MKLPLKGIKEYTECNTELDIILNILSLKVGAVEGFTDLAKMYEGIYVGQIFSKKDHPNADKLDIYEVSIGNSQNIQVVAGDKTVKVGNKVAYIKPGYIVPYTYGTSTEVKIKAVNMRGVMSEGMICSEKELNLGPNHQNVLVLDTDAQVGIPFAEYYDLNDVVVDIENKALTNRGDLFGILGLSREIAAAQDIPFVSPNWYKQDSIDKVIEKDILPLKVDNQAANLCPRYMCVAMDNIVVLESPSWLKSILIKAGIKPINNVVDITNYLSISTGQPLHAFDYDKFVSKDINGKGEAHITVRIAKDGEKIHTLDGNLVQLSNNNLVIADSTNPVAIGGVIGGMDTEIDRNTKRVIIESANFNKYNIRKTSMELGIFTEAVTRYTKGQHPFYCLPNLLRAMDLIEEIAQGTQASNIQDIYPEPILPKGISLSISKLNSHLGTTLGKEDVKRILTNLEYTILSEEGEYITIVAPIFRTDIYIPEDIYEDIGRIYGYDNILPRLPLRDITPARINRGLELRSRIRSILSNSGCNEIDTYSFTSKNTIYNSNQDPNLAYHIKNALSPDLEFMRTSLITLALEKGKYNIQKNISPFCIYEFNIPHQNKYVDNFKLPKEDWHLSVLFSSKEDIFDGSPFYQVKTYLEKILNTLGIHSLAYELISDSSQVDLPIWVENVIPSFNSNEAALLTHTKEGKSTVIGVIGDISNKVKDNFKLPKYTAAFEINLEEILKLVGTNRGVINESKYPTISQDINITVLNSTKYIDLEECILKIVNSKNRIGNVECIDIYQKDDNTKNITLRIQMEDTQKTLTDLEFDKIKDRIEEKTKVFN